MRDRGLDELTAFTSGYELLDDDTVRECARGGPALDTAQIGDPIDRDRIEARIAVHVAYRDYAQAVAARLSARYSVLCICEKGLNFDLAEWIKADRALAGWQFFHVGAAPGEQHRERGVDNLLSDLYTQLIAQSVERPRVVVLDHLD